MGFGSSEEDEEGLKMPICQAPKKQADGLRLGGFSGGNYFLLQQKNKIKNQERKVLPAEHYPGIPEGLSCLLLLPQVLPTENLGHEVSVTPPYKCSTWKSNTY